MRADDGAPHAAIGVLAAGVIATAVFALAVGGGYVYDDHRFLEANAALTDPSILWRAFADPAAQTADGSHAGLWRPLRTLSFALDRALFGGAPWGSHLVNLLLHGAGTAAVAALLLRWGTRAGAAFLGALLYGLHPVQVECVAWISSRGDLLAAACLWVSLLLASKRHAALAVAAGCAALLSKEQAVVWPVLAFLSGSLAGDSPRIALRRAAAPAVATVAFVAVRFALLDEPGQQGGLGPVGVVDVAAMLAHQTWFALFPVGSLFDWQMPAPGAGTALSRVALLLAAALPCAGLVLARTRVAAAWFLAALSPTLFVQAMIPMNIRVADRFLLFALPALAILVARAGRSLRPVLGSAALGALCFAVLSVSLVPAWASDEALWGRTAARVPGHWRAEHHLGVEALRRGDAAEAVRRMRLAVAAGPDDGLTRFHLAQALEALGKESNDPVLVGHALVEYLSAGALLRRPRASGAAVYGPLASVAAVDVTLLLGEKERARGGLEALLAAPPTAEARASEAWQARVERLARRAATHLDEALAARVRQWATSR